MNSHATLDEGRGGQALLALGVEKLRAGDHAGAIRAFEAVVAADQEHALATWARYYLGGIYQRKGDIKKAMELFTGAIVKDPGFWRAHNSLATLFQQSGAPQTACKHFERSLQQRPNQPDVQKPPCGSREPAATSAFARITRSSLGPRSSSRPSTPTTTRRASTSEASA